MPVMGEERQWWSLRSSLLIALPLSVKERNHELRVEMAMSVVLKKYMRVI